MKKQIIKLTSQSFKIPLTFLSIFIGIAAWRTIATGHAFYFIIFGYIGGSIAIGTFLSHSLVQEYKPWGRKITQLLVGLFMLGFMGFLAHENMQIEGFFFYLFAGIFSGAYLHYFIAKLVGPVLFGRGWCGWACWTTMILDFLPWTKPAQARIKYLGLLRYVHFILSFAVIFALYYLFDYGFDDHDRAELSWLVLGNAFYYALAIILAAVLKDNRAFCKYICPIPATQKVASRFSIYKQQIDFDNCTECEFCEEHCPMNVRLLDYARNNQRILSTECVLCDTCIHICPEEVITTTKRFDMGMKEYINVK